MRPLRLVWWSALLGVLASPACGDDDGGGTTGMDAGRGADAAPMDADGPPVDAGTADAGPVSCPEGDCDLLRNTGCAGSLGCYFAITGSGEEPAPTCLDNQGSGGDGDPCSAVRDCKGGFFCDRSSDAGTGTCRRLCCGGSSASCPQGQRCALGIRNAQGELTDVAFCRPTDDCNVRMQEGCPAGQGCYPSGSQTLCLASRRDLPEGAQCETLADCTGGTACFVVAPDAGSASSQCLSFCDPTASATADACGDDERCEDLELPDMNAGVCTPRDE